MVVKSELITSLSLQLSDIPPKDVEYGVNSILERHIGQWWLY